MSFLGEPFKHDLFVSYSHGAFNGQHDSELKRWSQKFAKDLRAELAGTTEFEEISVFLEEGDGSDENLDRTEQLTALLRDRVANSGLLTVLMTPQYLRSKWCRQELDWWCEKNHSDTLGAVSRIFVCHVLPTDDAVWPKPIKSVVGYFCYDRNKAPDEARPFTWRGSKRDLYDYKELLVDLSGEMMQRLREIRAALEKRRRRDEAAERLAADGGQVIYLHARVTDVEAWQRASDLLVNKNFVVLPAEPDPIAREPKAMREIAEHRVETLSGCDALLLLGTDDARTFDADLQDVAYRDRQSARARSDRLLPCAVLDTVGPKLGTPQRKKAARALAIEWLDATRENWPVQVKSWLIEQSALVGAVGQPDEQVVPSAPASLPELLSGFVHDGVDGQPDALGVAIDALSFARVIADREVQPPLAIGVFGEWGSGKSFFMHLLREQIRRITATNNDAFCKNIVQIEFNAWHYVEANLWASLVHQIFSRLHQHFKQINDEEAAVRLFAELETARILRAEAEERRTRTQHELDQAEKELKEKRSEVRRHLSLKQLARDEIWEDLQIAQLPDPLRSKVERFEREAGVEQVLTSGRELREAIGEFRGLMGRAYALYRGWLRLSMGWRAVTGFLVILGSLIMFDFGGFFGDYVLRGAAGFVSKITAAAACVIVVISTAARHSRNLIGLAEWLDGALKDQQEAEQQARIDALTIEAQQAEQKVVDAEERLRQSVEAVKEAALPRRFARFIEERIRASDYQRHLGIVAMIRDDFEKLSDLMARKHERQTGRTNGQIKDTILDALPMIDRIVLYIDDLDRCPSERVVQVLEAIHLLLAFPLFVVVVGVDVRWTSRSLLQHYPSHLMTDDLDRISLTSALDISDRDARTTGEARSSADMGDRIPLTNTHSHTQAQATPHDYLEKIFQIPFWLRPLDGASSRRLLEALTVSRGRSDGAERAGNRSAKESRSGADEKSEPSGSPHVEHMEAAQVSMERVPGVRADQTVSPASSLEALRFEQHEQRFILELAPYVGRSPRQAKRFLNVYRIIKAGCPEAERGDFVVAEGQGGSYRAAVTLLALTTGAPHLASMIFARVDADNGHGNVGSLSKELEKLRGNVSDRELEAALGALRHYNTATEGQATLAQFKQWQARVSRFTFRFGRD
jgi:hypothetical protein